MFFTSVEMQNKELQMYLNLNSKGTKQKMQEERE
jgi:hypothetical protein